MQVFKLIFSLLIMVVVMLVLMMKSAGGDKFDNDLFFQCVVILLLLLLFQARILELIGLVQHRELTASLLDLNDQMNNQLLRFFIRLINTQHYNADLDNHVLI